MARVESVTDGLERVLTKLDRVDDHIVDLRVRMVEITAALANVRALIDGAHARAAKLEADALALVERVRTLEDELVERRGTASRRTAATVGAAVGGGGAVAALAEVVRAMIVA